MTPYIVRLQYTGEKSFIGNGIDVCLPRTFDSLVRETYPGVDASVTIYEDDPDNYNYEKAKFTCFEITWNDKNSMLFISDCKGEYSDMPISP